MGFTRYLLEAGDAHGRGPDLGLMDPISGAFLEVEIISGTVGVSDVLRGATSGVVMRVTRKLGATSLIVEIIGSGTGTAPGIPIYAPSQATAVATGETLNTDTGAVLKVAPTLHTVGGTFKGFYFGGETQLPYRLGEAELFTTTPTIAASDAVFWDATAKIATRIRVAVSSVTPIAPAIAFAKGDKVTTSGGGSFVIVSLLVDGADLVIAIAKKAGSIAAGQILTNVTRTGSGQINVLGGSVEIDWGTGAWVPHAQFPNANGLGSFYEVEPWGDGGGIGIYGPVLRSFYAKWSANVDPLERGVRLMPFSVFQEAVSAQDQTNGGVMVQRVKCAGTFPTTWVKGETLVCGTWQARFWSHNPTEKWLYVTHTNGQTLGAATLQGMTSGNTATTLGPAIGWRKGSTHWNAFFAERTKARAYSHPNGSGLYLSQPAKDVGLILTIWESEIAAFGLVSGVAAEWPTVNEIVEQWQLLIAEFRTELAEPALPITLYSGDERSQSTIASGGRTFASLLRAAFARIDQSSNIGVVDAKKLEVQAQQTSSLPYTETAWTYLRPLDYLAIGHETWSALAYAQLTIPPGSWGGAALIVGIGGDLVNGGLDGDALMYDGDPLLQPSVDFPGADTRVPSLFVFDDPMSQYRLFDIKHAPGSRFLGHSGAGPEPAILTRAARRFAPEGVEFGDVCFVKLGFAGAAFNAAATGAKACWDPDGTTRIVTPAANCHVTKIAPIGAEPGRARFTAAPGTFSGWQVSRYVAVDGSLLGLVGEGGNNTQPWGGVPCRVVASNGSYIELEGNDFVAEGGTGVGYLVNNGAGYSPGATTIAIDTGTGTVLLGDRITFASHGTVYTVTSALSAGSIVISPPLTNSVPDNNAVTVQGRTITLTQGPFPLTPEGERVMEIAIEKVFSQLHRVPRAVYAYCAGGEFDTEQTASYRAAMLRFVDWLNGLVSQRLKGETRLPLVLIETTSQTGFPASDEQIASVIQTQQEVATQTTNAQTVPTSDLPMKLGPGGNFPPTTRFDNSIEYTVEAVSRIGKRVDYVSSLLPGVPPHPDGEQPNVMPTGFAGSGGTGGESAGAGADTGGSVGLDAVPAPPDEGGSTDIDDPVLIDLVVEDGSGKADSDSYLSVTEFRDRARKWGNPTEVTAASDEQVQLWLRRAGIEGIDRIFMDVLQGVRASDTQAMEWPRVGAADNRTQRAILTNTVPEGWKQAQFWYAMALVQNIDLMANRDHTDDDERKRFATSWSEDLPGGLSESQTYGMGVPTSSYLPRMEAAARPYLLTASDVAGAV